MAARQAQTSRWFVNAAPRTQGVGRRWPLADNASSSVERDVLRILWDEACHGDAVTLAIEEQRGYRPPPWLVQRTLRELEAGGFVSASLVDSRHVYTITDAGCELLANYCDTQSEAGLSEPPGGNPLARSIRALNSMRSVLREIARTRKLELYADTLTIVERARRELFALLEGQRAGIRR